MLPSAVSVGRRRISLESPPDVSESPPLSAKSPSLQRQDAAVSPELRTAALKKDRSSTARGQLKSPLRKTDSDDKRDAKGKGVSGDKEGRKGDKESDPRRVASPQSARKRTLFSDEDNPNDLIDKMDF